MGGAPGVLRFAASAGASSKDAVGPRLGKAPREWSAAAAAAAALDNGDAAAFSLAAPSSSTSNDAS